MQQEELSRATKVSAVLLSGQARVGIVLPRVCLWYVEELASNHCNTLTLLPLLTSEHPNACIYTTSLSRSVRANGYGGPVEEEAELHEVHAQTFLQNDTFHSSFPGQLYASWQDGPCKKCMCVPTEDSSSPSVECVLAKCEPLNLVSDEYVFNEVQEEDECCPTAEKIACLANGKRLEVQQTGSCYLATFRYHSSFRAGGCHLEGRKRSLHRVRVPEGL